MFEDAETFFEKTIKLGPNLIEAYYELGGAHWFAGDKSKATSTWEDGFKANKFNPWGKKCQEMLELVGKGEEPQHLLTLLAPRIELVRLEARSVRRCWSSSVRARSRRET